MLSFVVSVLLGVLPLYHNVQAYSATTSSIAFTRSSKYRPAFRTTSSNNVKARPSPSHRTTSLFASTNENDDNNSDFDVEAARKRFESLLGSSSSTLKDTSFNELSKEYFKSPTMRVTASSEGDPSKGFVEYEIPPPPPLTSSDRKRKELEIELLKKLETSDEPIEQLWDLWYNERGVEAAAKLRQADALAMDGPSGWDKAEQMLKELITEYGIHWAEPSNRLATLYYLQGKIQASEAICHVVLAVKPWHFGALSGLVMIYTALQDEKKVQQYAARRLLGLVPNDPQRSRSAWVQHNVALAQTKLDNGTKILNELFGTPDDHVTRDNNNDIITNDDENSWQ